MMIPGTGEERQALGDYVNSEVEEELVLGEVQASKEVTKGTKKRTKRRPEPYESDENELMATWTSRSRKPNTQYRNDARRNYNKIGEYYLRNYNVCIVSADETNSNAIRNRNAYTTEDYVKVGKVMLPYVLPCASHVLSEIYDIFGVFSEYYKEVTKNGAQNTKNQESASLVPGYAPRYPIGKKFHDVVREIVQELVSNRVVFQGTQIVVFFGTPVGLITWIILAYYSSVFLATASRSRRKRQGKTRGDRKATAVSRKQCKSLL